MSPVMVAFLFVAFPCDCRTGFTSHTRMPVLSGAISYPGFKFVFGLHVNVRLCAYACVCGRARTLGGMRVCACLQMHGAIQARPHTGSSVCVRVCVHPKLDEPTATRGATTYTRACMLAQVARPLKNAAVCHYEGSLTITDIINVVITLLKKLGMSKFARTRVCTFV